MKGRQVSVRRERPTALAWAVALAVTMLVVYVLTLNASLPDAVESVSAAPRVTQTIELEALEMWCVSMGRWDSAESARVEAAGFTARGAAGCVHEIDGAWYVLGAMYDTERAAKRVAARLRDGEGTEAEVLRLEADGVTLRVTAPDQQIDAIGAADAALRAQVDRLGGIALQLDRRELEPDAARTLCALASTEVLEAGGRLSDMPGARENALCAALIGRAEALSGQLDGIAASAQTSGGALSGMVRLIQIDAFLGLRDLRRGLLSG